MANQADSITSKEASAKSDASPSWMKFGLIAMASAVLGGMATAWWYRKTLIRLRQAEETTPNPQIGIWDDDSVDEI